MDTGLATIRLAAVSSPRTLPIAVALTGADTLRAEIAAWRALAARAAEPGPLRDPDTMLAALQHLPGGRDVPLLVARRGPELQAVIPLAPSGRFGLAARDARPWRPDPLVAVPPLVTADRTGEVLEALLDGLAARDRRFGRLRFEGLDPDGPVAAALAALAQRSGRALVRAPGPGRALLRPDDATGAAQARTRRLGLDPRLAERGPARMERARSPRQIRDAVEILLTLDGMAATRARPALVADPGTASFLRTATRQLAAQRRLRAEVLWLGDRPAAAALVAIGPGVLALWRAAAEPGPLGAAAEEALALSLAAGAARQGLDLVDLRAEAPLLAGAVRRPTLELAVETRPGLASSGFRAAIGRRVAALRRA
ncbi:MAG TPA: GNAT family N-acetyltransferase [Salinarimonas sp.]|nr:GNAT family N-acetyltransferase [Salinarimonas sp.]